ncbi:MAG: hypothetical protein RR253_03695 [Oscillospiraceae bacterium]
MLFDIYMIILTSFAILGLYTFLDMLGTAMQQQKMPRSVTVMAYSQDSGVLKKVYYLQNNVFNNKIVLIDNDELKINSYADTDKILTSEISQYITDVLFTKGGI